MTIMLFVLLGLPLRRFQILWRRAIKETIKLFKCFARVTRRVVRAHVHGVGKTEKEM